MFKRSSKPKTLLLRRAVKDLIPLHSAEHLLSDNRRESILAGIRKAMHLDELRYNSLARTLFHSLVNYYQSLPDSTLSFYQQAGGLLDHALQRTEAALSIFQRYLLCDAQGTYSEIQMLWQYALFTAALLQGIGKLYIDYSIALYDEKGHFLTHWNPLLESLISHGSYYEYAFKDVGNEEMRCRLNLLLARQLMPISGFNWIASDEQVLSVWLALLNEDRYTSGTLGCILDTADAIALQQEMERWLKLWGMRGQRMTRLSTFSDRSQETLAQIEQQTGMQFLQWVRQALAQGTLMINKSPLFIVPGGLLMSTEIFKLFIRENPQFKNWQAVQKGFVSLGLHEHAPDGSLHSKFEQHKNQHLISGIALGSNSAVLLPAEAKLLQLGSGEVHSLSRDAMVHQIRNEQHFRSSGQAFQAEPLQALMADGQWHALSFNLSSPMQPGSRKS